jgi:hypothetical protein
MSGFMLDAPRRRVHTATEALMHPRLISVALSLIAAAAPISSARADVIFNNFGPADAYTTTGGQSVSSFVNVGVKFVPAAAVTPLRVTLALKATTATTVTIAICSETSNRPGTVITSTSIMVDAGDPHLYTAEFPAAVALTAGTTYWIRASGGVETWMRNSIGQIGYTFTSTTGAWNQSPNGNTPAVRLEDDTPVLASGACCAGSTCSIATAAACTGPNTRYVADNTACNAVSINTTPCCKANFNQSTGAAPLEVQDIFDFLNAWFADNAQADINGGGLAVQDIFDFLNIWFEGC